MKKAYSLTIGWLYPDLMSTYGDRGNVLVLQKKCLWNNIELTVLVVNQETSISELKNVNLIFGGGSQDIQQELVMRDLKGEKGESIKDLIEKNVPALFVCGSPQIMGKYYEPAVGKRIEGLGVFDMISVNPGPEKQRCIGNIIAEVEWKNLDLEHSAKTTTIVGFENHGGRTHLGRTAKPFAKVLYGNGNNGDDSTEGVVYKNAVGCYFHGPLLPKNPEIADFLIQKAVEVKYGEKIDIKTTKDTLAAHARDTIMKRYSLKK